MSQKTFLIVRNIPGIGASTPEELKAASQKSNEAIAQVPGVEWVNSYVVQDQTFCIYKAPSEAEVRKHAEISGFPANEIKEIATGISPATAN